MRKFCKISYRSSKGSINGAIDGNDFLDEALRRGKEKLMEDQQARIASAKIAPNTPSYRHFRLVAAADELANITRLGQLTNEITKYFIKERPGERENLTSISIADSSEFKEYCVHRDARADECAHLKYRTVDGYCNNIEHVREWGVAMRPFRRILPPDYCDGISQPRCGSRKVLPPARDVTLKLHRANYKSDHKFNFMFAVWGQFVDHDITSTAITRIIDGQLVSCCETSGIDDCFPVMLSQDDPFFLLYNTTCMEFVRSVAAPNCMLGPREQLNQVTSYLDGSVIYGSTTKLSKRLRSFSRGRLAVTYSADGKELLPISIDLSDGCNREEEANKGRYCFLAGDSRSNENLHLTTLHLIMLRQHNRIAGELAKVSPHWDDERLYQETKRIVTAQLQHVTYQELLEPLLGQEIMDRYNLTLLDEGFFTAYDENLDPTVANSFATAAFRFAHSLLPGLMRSYETTSPGSWMLLRKVLFNPFPLYSSGSLDRILQSAIKTDVQKTNRFFTTEVTQHLFEEPQNETSPKKCGLDLVSLNIQRGRDHGLPGYVKWLEHCGLPRPEQFKDLSGLIDEESLKAMKLLYESPDDVDLYSGALSEIPLKGSILGPTATCLIADQFKRIKLGDRFWYENANGPYPFTEGQLREIRKTTLAGIVCDNADNVTDIPKKLLLFSSTSNEEVECATLNKLSYEPWRES
ncbi:Animal haem peroxidase [Nesidiocoris tenuis]|uniref:Animal haem peroxidase n=1 Tax=Nesidiocoris tenuis TaxID=355587 RepID=A0ABN7ACT4_9HEMI|nr:Animal haem peroxidase [Nesidiocoris tenuis]